MDGDFEKQADMQHGRANPMRKQSAKRDTEQVTSRLQSHQGPMMALGACKDCRTHYHPAILLPEGLYSIPRSSEDPGPSDLTGVPGFASIHQAPGKLDSPSSDSATHAAR
ncbi:hypothetical protein PV10_04809 [Exophiala mesophila]|uniref:Uncharacterized protein n=1 Tax=Exophiala mesophila TaxID=212818 RepID=A0A0D2A3P2_EXOME|nr:uncharacterized protein PV10_04809 [Exophiala mesophila]KIV93608.1 hypothetical protein PV10_04809 [Exophiala mesophila]